MTEMRMFKWMPSVNRKDQLRNEFLRNRLGVAPVTYKLTKND